MRDPSSLGEEPSIDAQVLFMVRKQVQSNPGVPRLGEGLIVPTRSRVNTEEPARFGTDLNREQRRVWGPDVTHRRHGRNPLFRRMGDPGRRQAGRHVGCTGSPRSSGDRWIGLRRRKTEGPNRD
jgi:hypothetical protein